MPLITNYLELLSIYANLPQVLFVFIAVEGIEAYIGPLATLAGQGLSNKLVILRVHDGALGDLAQLRLKEVRLRGIFSRPKAAPSTLPPGPSEGNSAGDQGPSAAGQELSFSISPLALAPDRPGVRESLDYVSQCFSLSTSTDRPSGQVRATERRTSTL
jgi:hypothetical protein